MNRFIGISIGDINGIGPEIVLKALAQVKMDGFSPVIISPEKIIQHYKDISGLGFPLHICDSPDQFQPDSINVLNLPVNDFGITPGAYTKESGLIAMRSIETGIELALNGKTSALVTAPISKEAVNKAGYHIPGHTEFLAQKTDASSFLMMLVNDQLRVALNTVHIPIAQVASSIHKEGILKNLTTLQQSLKTDFGIAEPQIAVLGLNPHAGDGGVIGMEEQEIITPAVVEATGKGMKVSGPFPADGFFGQKSYLNYDAILAMYHDQGLAPFKLLSFGNGVNFTAGLPIIRTSPDHGTAFDIAGKDKADPSSFTEAYTLAMKLSLLRNEG